MRQITITNGDKMVIIDSETGQKMVQDLKKMREKSGLGTVTGGQMGLDKAKEYFDLSLAQKGGDYVIAGVPKKENKFLGKMEFYVDGDKWVPIKIYMYDAKGKLMSQSTIEYQQVAGLYVPVKNISNISTPMGKMAVEMTFENIKVNEGIGDGEFKVE
jgi:outer membrane lipoprotein-sorting protein